jgi:hypothetical protein
MVSLPQTLIVWPRKLVPTYSSVSVVLELILKVAARSAPPTELLTSPRPLWEARSAGRPELAAGHKDRGAERPSHSAERPSHNALDALLERC